jgi:predicted XRE-type DNA-binding protein
MPPIVWRCLIKASGIAEYSTNGESEAMLTGEELGSAIREAIKLKGVKFVEVARQFGVSPPSVQDWMRRGTISKDKLPMLWSYFSDVAGPEHWGLVDYPTTSNVLTDSERALVDDFRLLTDDDQQELASEIARRAAKLRTYLQRMSKAPSIAEKVTPIAETLTADNNRTPGNQAGQSALERTSLSSLVNPKRVGSETNSDRTRGQRNKRA